MSGFVLDASIALAWCFDDEATDETTALLDRMERESAHVPSLWHIEVANVVAISGRKGRLSPARAAEFAALIDALPILVDEEKAGGRARGARMWPPGRALREILDLARHERLTAYDAAYLELAMRQGLPLATRDEELRGAADRVGVALVLGT